MGSVGGSLDFKGITESAWRRLAPVIGNEQRKSKKWDCLLGNLLHPMLFIFLCFRDPLLNLLVDAEQDHENWKCFKILNTMDVINTVYSL